MRRFLEIRELVYNICFRDFDIFWFCLRFVILMFFEWSFDVNFKNLVFIN